MYLMRALIVAFTAASISASAGGSDEFLGVLLKRQTPGTPAYNCHDNCGGHSPIPTTHPP